MCEGHNVACQDLLREQPAASGNINIIQLVCDALVTSCESTLRLQRMDYIEVHNVKAYLGE